jgi:choline dehydrogenase-like flavoprotein
MSAKPKMYDYIIVGAGSAGCVLAARLTEDPNVRVLLLEAGCADSAKEVRIPAAFSKLYKTSVDWNYSTEPEPFLRDRRLYWPRGKMLGGSSSMNAMIYVRGNPLDYDHWAALGNEGWSFSDVLPYFKKSEMQQRGASEYHGTIGPLCVSDLRCVNELTRAFLSAAEELGMSANSDFNGARQDGAGLYQVTQKNGRRHSAADAYLRPRWRGKSLRFAKEQKAIADWLVLIARTAPEDYGLALELAECPRIVKGYGDTHAQGERNYEAVMGALPKLRGQTDAATRLRRLREAALADDTGEKLAKALAEALDAAPVGEKNADEKAAAEANKRPAAK